MKQKGLDLKKKKDIAKELSKRKKRSMFQNGKLNLIRKNLKNKEKDQRKIKKDL
jgi:hypothetical protein